MARLIEGVVIAYDNRLAPNSSPWHAMVLADRTPGLYVMRPGYHGRPPDMAMLDRGKFTIEETGRTGEVGLAMDHLTNTFGMDIRPYVEHEEQLLAYLAHFAALHEGWSAQDRERADANRVMHAVELAIVAVRGTEAADVVVRDDRLPIMLRRHAIACASAPCVRELLDTHSWSDRGRQGLAHNGESFYSALYERAEHLAIEVGDTKGLEAVRVWRAQPLSHSGGLTY